MDSNADRDKILHQEMQQELLQEAKNGFSEEYLDKVALMKSLLPHNSRHLYTNGATPFFIYDNAFYYDQRKEHYNSRTRSTYVFMKLQKYTIMNNRLVEYSVVGKDIDFVLGIIFAIVFVIIGVIICKEVSLWGIAGILVFSPLPIIGAYISRSLSKKKMETVWNTNKRSDIPVKKSLDYDFLKQ